MIQVPKFPELTFDEKSHVYKLNALEIPSVSAVMRTLSDSYYGRIDSGILSNAAGRGTAVHHAIENYHEFGIVDIPAEHEGYFRAFLLWIEVEKASIIATESRVYHRFMRYAGTCDAVCFIQNGVLTCVDYKTSSQIVEMLVRVQLEAYAKAFESHGLKFDAKQVIHLRKDGSYEIKRFICNDSEAWEVFCGLMTVQNYINKFRR